MLSTWDWYNFVLVLMVNKVLSQTLFPRCASAADALTICWFSAVSRERLLEMVEPSYVKFSTSSRVQSPMEMVGMLLTSWPRMLVFLRKTV